MWLSDTQSMSRSLSPLFQLRMYGFPTDLCRDWNRARRLWNILPIPRYVPLDPDNKLPQAHFNIAHLHPVHYTLGKLMIKA